MRIKVLIVRLCDNCNKTTKIIFLRLFLIAMPFFQTYRCWSAFWGFQPSLLLTWKKENRKIRRRNFTVNNYVCGYYLRQIARLFTGYQGSLPTNEAYHCTVSSLTICGFVRLFLIYSHGMVLNLALEEISGLREHLHQFEENWHFPKRTILFTNLRPIDIENQQYQIINCS